MLYIEAKHSDLLLHGALNRDNKLKSISYFAQMISGHIQTDKHLWENFWNLTCTRNQGGIFPGKVERLFPGSIEISQEILIYLKSCYMWILLHNKIFLVTRIIFLEEKKVLDKRKISCESTLPLLWQIPVKRTKFI